MKQYVLEALKAAIRKWDQNSQVRKKGKYLLGPAECALCHVFNDSYMPVSKQCIGCPIMENTGRKFCDDTPYEAADRAWEKWHLDGGDAARAAARVERNYLIAFLPEGETWK